MHSHCKIVCDIDRHHTDDETLQISALKTLVTALSPKGVKDSLCFIFSEFDVSLFHCMS